jgi:hypothetical protein
MSENGKPLNRPPPRPEPPGKLLKTARQPSNRPLIWPRRQREHHLRRTPLLRTQPQPFTLTQLQAIAWHKPVIFRIVTARSPHWRTLNDQPNATANLHRNGFTIAYLKRDACGYFSHDSLRQKSCSWL